MKITNLLNKFSFLQKMFLSQIPIIISLIVLSVTVFRSINIKDDDLFFAMAMREAVNEIELESVKMSTGLYLFLLDPTNQEAWQKKEKADSAIDEIVDRISAVDSSGELSSQAKTIKEYDQTTLAKIENKLKRLFEERSLLAHEYYLKTYVPAREVQEKQLKTLQDLTQKHVGEETVKVEAQKIKRTATILGLLWIGSLFGLLVSFYVINQSASRIKQIAHKLGEESNQLYDSAEKVSSFSEELAQATTEQAAALVQTTATAETLLFRANQNAASAEASASSVNESTQTTQVGKKAVEKMINAMEEIKVSNDEIKGAIDENNNQISAIVSIISEIENKTKVINDIVFQTKLLSFNASVEAARAGEHGKGFAVVAEEVGNLAQMSGNAAKEISSMLTGSIQKVQDVVSKTKDTIETLSIQGTRKVEEGVLTANSCNKALDAVVDSVQVIAGKVKEIAGSTQEQMRGVNEITNTMGQMDSSTRQNATTSEQTSTAAKSLESQAVVLKEIVLELNDLIKGSNG
jgi:methyl-accepting chemotaxis protein